MANTVVAALAGARLFSVTLVPVLASFVYRRPIAQRQSPVLRWAARALRAVAALRAAAPLVPLVGALARRRGLDAAEARVGVPARAERGRPLV
jgi:cobalt-zinc-cadmium resistance protein CzcA